MLIVSKGEVDLLYNLEGKEVIIHTLTQGAHIGGYQVHGQYSHVFMARARSSTTIHYITKEDLINLRNKIPELKYRFDRLYQFMKKTK